MFTLTLQASVLFELSKIRMCLLCQFKHSSKREKKKIKHKNPQDKAWRWKYQVRAILIY